MGSGTPATDSDLKTRQPDASVTSPERPEIDS